LTTPRREITDGGVHTLNDDLVRMTKQIMEVGPWIGEVARRTGVYKETLRYRFHKYFLERGFVVQANLDYHRLGLKRLVIIAKVAPIFEQHSVAIMSALSEMCYLTGFAETTLEGLYIMQVTVPSELRDECGELYKRLHDLGIFTKMQTLRFEEVRSVPMKPEYYDFSEGCWSYDWQGEEITGVALVPSGKADVERYDMSDLLILKELNIDANQTLTAIAGKLKISSKTLQHHYANHVLGRGLLKSYKILWQGTRYNAKTEKAESKHHTYFGVALLVTGTTEGQRAKLLANLNQMPFLWFEASDPNYYAELFIPIDSYNEFLRRIRELAVRTETRPQLFILDHNKALRFTIAYRLYSQEKKKWQLNSADVIARFENLVVNVKSSAGET
jgi:DNA-binding Lrp family transcriptional regulator